MTPAKVWRQKSGGSTPLSVGHVRKYFEIAVRGSKWEVLRGWHVLRHSFCSNCARRGVPDSIIDSWMGHRGDEDVKKRYRHLFPRDKRQFMSMLFDQDQASHDSESTRLPLGESASDPSANACVATPV